MASLHDLAASGDAFVAMSPNDAAPRVLQAGQSAAKGGVFHAKDLLERPGSQTGYASGPVPVFGEALQTRVAAAVDAALHALVVSGSIIPAYTQAPGTFRIVSPS